MFRRFTTKFTVTVGLCLLVGLTLFAGARLILAQTADTPEIIAYGDSLIAGQGVDSSLSLPGQLQQLTGGDYEITNRGETGAETDDLLQDLPSRVLAENPDIVILFAGGADFIPDFDEDGRLSAEETFANLEEMITEMQNEGTTVLLLGHGAYDIPGYTYVDYTAEFRELARDTEVYFVPDAMGDIGLEPEYTNADLIHPNARGYSLIALETFPVFQELLVEEFPRAPLAGSCQVDITTSEDRPELVFDESETVMTGQRVSWKAFTVGGSGNYEYEWDLEDETERGRDVSITYETEGQRGAEYTVTSSEPSDEDSDGYSQEAVISCPQTIEVLTPPLKGSCDVRIRLNEDEAEVSWDSDIAGGETASDHSYVWESEGEVVSTSSDFELTYDRSDTGRKSATLSVTSGPHETELTCSATIPDPDDATGTSTLESAACDVDGYDFEVGDTIHWQADVDPYTRRDEDRNVVATSTFSWSDTSGLATTGPEARITYDTVGVKTTDVTINALTGESSTLSCSAKIVPDTDGESRGGGGCFIATAAYGTAMAADVELLRDFRDNVLRHSPLGRDLIGYYYRFSPPIAEVIADSPVLKQLTRWLLAPTITTVKLARRW